MESRRTVFLYPLSLLYGLITDARNFLFDNGVLKSEEFKIPVICVGNITSGGTGKTPHIEYLIELLRKDFNVALLSRGYKRKSCGFRIAGPSSGVRDIGDEPMQIYRKFPDITVAVDTKRVRGIQNILKEKPDTSVILLDDGFQHRKVTPGFSILLTEFDRLMIRDSLLPYGNLRESISNTRRADIILVTKSPENISPINRRIISKEIDKAPYQNLYFTSLTYDAPKPLFEKVAEELFDFNGKVQEETGIVLVTGIANPRQIAGYLKRNVSEIVHLQFPDHHNFKQADIEKIHNAFIALKSSVKYVITTEKDAARLREFTNIAEPVRSSFYYIPVRVIFLNNDKPEFDNIIADYVRKNKRNNRVS